jgi:hypothetical protein
MKKKRRWTLPGGLLLAAIAVAALLFFSTSLDNLATGQAAEGRRQLEESLRRAAVACYAAEGSYPMDVAYLEEHYGIQIDKDRYTVRYDAFAQNLMPDITVLENGT